MIRPLKPTEFDSFYSLLEASLPPDEFRARDDQRRALDDPAFCPYVLVDAQEAVRGLVTVWDFDGFAFIEHLAVAPELRCGGLGSALLQDAFARRPKRFCLEVDPPETALARRRIAFYERNGLSLNAEYPYIQPSLGAGRRPLPLLLMTSGGAAPRDVLDRIRDTVYARVYRHWS